MFCRECGNEIKDNENVCSKCGRVLKTKSSTNYNNRKTGTIIELLFIILYFLITLIIFNNVEGAPQQTAICAMFIATVLVLILIELALARLDRRIIHNSPESRI